MNDKSTKRTKQKEQFEEQVLKFYEEILDDGNPIEQRKYMMSLLNFKIVKVESKNDRARRLSYFLRISILLLAGLSTVILGLKAAIPNWNSISVNIALVISSIITFMSGLAAFWDIENYRMRTKIMLNRLKELRYKFTFEAIGDSALTTEDLEKTMEEFITIIGDGYWERKFLQRLNKEVKSSNKKE